MRIKTKKIIGITTVSKTKYILSIGDENVFQPENGNENEYETTEYGTEGIYRETDGYIRISYDENAELGMEGISSTIIIDKNNERKIDLIRDGSMPGSLIFDLDSPRRLCSYTAFGGTFEMCVCTNDIKIEFSQTGGKIFLDYFIEIRGARSMHNIFTLTFRF